MTTRFPMYDLSPEQMDSLESGEAMLLCIPVQPKFTIGPDNGNALENQVLDSLPDLQKSDIDDIRPGYVWANVGTFRKDPPNTLSGLLGPIVSKRKIQPNDIVTSVFAILVSVHGGRLARQAANWPSGLIYFDTGQSNDRLYAAPDRPDRPTFRSPVNPEYFVDRDFGRPVEDDDEH